MQITKDDNERLVELDKKLQIPFIESVQQVMGLNGLELVRYGSSDNDPENDQGWDFYIRRIETKEVVNTGVSIDEIVASGLLLQLEVMMAPPASG